MDNLKAEQTVSDNIWHNILSEISSEISAESFETWLKPVTAINISNESLTLKVPNKFYKEWIIDHYLKFITKAAYHITQNNLRIDFSISKEENVLQIEKIKELKVYNKNVFLAPPKNDLYLNPKYTFNDFVVGANNRFAHAASMAVAQSPAKAYNPLFIYGGVGLGKTHLMQAIGHYLLKKNSQTKLAYVTSEKFTNQLITAIQKRTTTRFREKYRCVDVLLIDDIQFISGKESTQEEFFHTFNTLYDYHKQIIVSSDRSPKEILGLEERLVSRFTWGLVTDIQPPDFETRTAILKKKAEREIVKVPDDVLFFIAEKIRSNIRELEGALIRVVAYASLTNSKISITLAQEVLKDAIKEDFFVKVVSIGRIQKIVSENFNMRISDIKKSGRSKAIVYPRQIAMYLCRQMTNHSLNEIGGNFGGRDHTTVLHACEKIKQLRTSDHTLDELLTGFIHKIKTK
ncbi:MAG: chromosomal replication initiator protein DnaA [Candidatus Omnitrophota bacterium]|nr:MAG: chromosomal replication initiator protein DnaA [Candidatus Omnitrophota bacterium]